MVVGWTAVVLAALLLRRLIKAPWGRALRAIREDEDAVRSVGKNVFALKMQSLMIGGAFAGAAGIMLAIEQQSVAPDAFLPKITFFLFVMVILGGAGTIMGAVVGANSVVGPRSAIHAGALVYPDVVVGADCQLHGGCVVREGTRLGDRVIRPAVVRVAK